MILNKKNVTRIDIVENIGGNNVPYHTQIKISVSGEKPVKINSLEISNFSKLRQLITKDFEGLIEVSEFLNSKR